MCATPAPNCYFGSVTVWNAVRGVYFHHNCAPLRHRIATLYPPRSITVLRCVCGAYFQLPWLSLAAHVCPWLFLACSWLLLAAPGCSWAAPGCSWLLLAASGCSWLSLAVVNVNSRSKENNLFGVSRLGHILVTYSIPFSQYRQYSIPFSQYRQYRFLNTVNTVFSIPSIPSIPFPFLN
jgi:hypothetical protein